MPDHVSRPETLGFSPGRFILGPMVEEGLRQSLLISKGNFSFFISYARKPQAFSLGMNGILSKRSGGLFRHSLAWSKVMTGMPASQKPWALASGMNALL